MIDAKYVGTWELPALGAVTAPTAVLIRPDGYVAWVGGLTQLGLADALTTWSSDRLPHSALVRSSKRRVAGELRPRPLWEQIGGRRGLELRWARSVIDRRLAGRR